MSNSKKAASISGERFILFSYLLPAFDKLRRR